MLVSSHSSFYDLLQDHVKRTSCSDSHGYTCGLYHSDRSMKFQKSSCKPPIQTILFAERIKKRLSFAKKITCISDRSRIRKSDVLWWIPIVVDFMPQNYNRRRRGKIYDVKYSIKVGKKILPARWISKSLYILLRPWKESVVKGYFAG